MFFNVVNKKKYTNKKGLKRLSGLYAALKIRELVISFFYVTNRLKNWLSKKNIWGKSGNEVRVPSTFYYLVIS